jgi:recombination protein RecA
MANRKIKRRKQSKEEQMAGSIVRRRKKADDQSSVEFLHSGCTTLNLALSGKGANGGWARGRVDNVVGDGSSGKTITALEVAFWAWMKVKKIKSKIYGKVEKIIIVYNNCEGVMDFPLEKMYGKEFVDAVEWVCIKEIESMGRDFISRMRALKKGEFLLYIVDSWDALYSSADKKRFDDAIKDGKNEDGSYNLEKQKYAGKFFSNVCDDMEDNKKDATLFIISQVRQKIGVTFGKKTYRAGGKALDFYTHQVGWIREQQKLVKTKKGHKRVYGIRSEVKVERSKVAKPFREAQFTILYDYGIDDINSMADFLYGSGSIRWDKKNKFARRDSFVTFIEENNLEKELQERVVREWEEIEEAFESDVTKRKKRVV